MQQEQQLSQQKREELKYILQDVYRKADRALLEKSAEAQRTALQKTLEHYGASYLADAFHVAQKELDRLERDLEAKGFEVCGGGFRIASDAPDELSKMYEALVNEQVGSEKKRVGQLNEAIRNLWSIKTLSEAKQLLEAFAQ